MSCNRHAHTSHEHPSKSSVSTRNYFKRMNEVNHRVYTLVIFGIPHMQKWITKSRTLRISEWTWWVSSIEFSLRGLCTLFLINGVVRDTSTTPLMLREKTWQFQGMFALDFVQSKVFFVILFLALGVGNWCETARRLSAQYQRNVLMFEMSGNRCLPCRIITDCPLNCNMQRFMQPIQRGRPHKLCCPHVVFSVIHQEQYIPSCYSNTHLMLF